MQRAIGVQLQVVSGRYPATGSNQASPGTGTTRFIMEFDMSLIDLSNAPLMVAV